MLASSLDDQQAVRGMAKLLLELGARWRRTEVVDDGALGGHDQDMTVPQQRPPTTSSINNLTAGGPASTTSPTPSFDFVFTSPTAVPATTSSAVPPAPAPTQPNPHPAGLDDFLVTGMPQIDDNGLQWGFNTGVVSNVGDREYEALLESLLWHPAAGGSGGPVPRLDFDSHFSGLYDTLLGDTLTSGAAPPV